MKIVVCVKQTVDSEAMIVLEDGGVARDERSLVIDPFSEYAVERAVRFKEEQGGEVVVVSIGSEDARSAVRHAMAIGADRAVLVEVDDEPNIDSQDKARILTEIIKAEQADLVMGGYMSADTSNGQLMPRVATALGLPCIYAATKLEAVDGLAKAEHETDEGSQQVEVSLPAVICVQEGIAEPRYPTMRDIMQTKKKEIAVKKLDELGITLNIQTALRMTLRLKPPRKGGFLVEGESVSEKISNVSNVLFSGISVC